MIRISFPQLLFKEASSLSLTFNRSSLNFKGGVNFLHICPKKFPYWPFTLLYIGDNNFETEGEILEEELWHQMQINLSPDNAQIRPLLPLLHKTCPTANRNFTFIMPQENMLMETTKPEWKSVKHRPQRSLILNGDYFSPILRSGLGHDLGLAVLSYQFLQQFNQKRKLFDDLIRGVL